MVKARKLSPLPILDEASVRAFMEERGIKQLHARQMWKLICKHRPERLEDVDALSMKEMGKQLPTGMIAAFAEQFTVLTSKVVEKHESRDGTIKLLVELQDGQRVEAVIIRHDGRNTLCVSSQIGCQMGCTFCATGTMGIKGNLCGGEILEQLYHAQGVAPIRNVVFMGMGEPLNNYDAVMDSVRGMTDVKRFRLSHHQVTISTVGVVHAIKKMSIEFPHLNLALSLHAPTQALRQQIVPSAKAFPIEKLLAACYEHTRVSKKNLFVEYVLLKNVNDRPEHAHELGSLLAGQAVIINLIPYNPTDVAMDFDTPEDNDVDTFYEILVNEYKLLTTIRVHHGREIGGACGQLALTKPGAEGGGVAGPKGAPALNDIEDLMDAGRGGSRGRGEKAWGKGSGGGGAVGPQVVRATKEEVGTTAGAGKGGCGVEGGKKAVGVNEGEAGEVLDVKRKEAGAVDARDDDERALSRKRMPEAVSCGRATWLLSLAGASVALVAGLVMLRVGITVWVVKEERANSKR